MPMNTSLDRLILAFLCLIALQSCGGMETIVSVYPDGSAQLAYSIEAPVGQMPDLAAMGKADMAEIFKKDRYLSQEPQKLIDSLVTFGVQPLLARLKSRGEIKDFRVTDSTEFTQKKVRITIDLNSYSQVGPIHSSFKREIPALDSILSKLRKRAPGARADSIAIVSLGDSLEMQLHHFVVEPQLITMTREERIANGRRMLDSVLNMITSPESIFSYLMTEEERDKMLDSMNSVRSLATDDMLDSVGRAYQLMGDMGGELFKPKITLRAPLMLSNNEAILSGRFTTTPKSGARQFEPSTPYGDITPTSEPVRQRFKLSMPIKRSFSLEERSQWRSILGWCDECEQSFLKTPSKQRAENIVFHPLPDQKYLVEVDCGLSGGNKVRMFFTLGDKAGMPGTGVHQFEQGFYVDDPASELRRGSPRVLSERSDLLVGKISYDKSARTITIDRATAKETYALGRGYPERIKGSYKDRSGKWISLDDVTQTSVAFDAVSSCAVAAEKSYELEMGSTSSGWQNDRE